MQQHEITSTEEWQQVRAAGSSACVCSVSHTLQPTEDLSLCLQVVADQPLTASRRRQLLLNFLQAKLEAEDDQLLLEGARVREAVGSSKEARS